MQVVSYHNKPSEFLDAARVFLYSQEVENGVIIGNTEAAIIEPTKFDNLFLYIVLDSENQILLAGFQSLLAGNYLPLFLTSTKNLESVEVLFTHLSHNNHISNISEVHSSYDVAEAFTNLYNNTMKKSTTKFIKFKEERIYTTANVNPESLIGQGTLAIANTDSFNLAVSWYGKFMIDLKQCSTINEVVLASIKQQVTLALSQRRVYFWVRDDIPVAMAVQNRETKNIASIGRVYTPPQERTKGYATLLVAHITSYCLEEQGLAFCALITDRANPVSNSVYKKIGFEPSADFVAYKLQPA